MLRIVAVVHGIQKVFRSYQARAPCQKLGSDPEYISIDQSKQNDESVRCFQRSGDLRHRGSLLSVPLSQPLPHRLLAANNKKSRLGDSQPIDSGEESHYSEHAADTCSYQGFIEGVVLGAGFVLLKNIHAYCSGRKSGTHQNEARYCPVTQVQKLSQSKDGILAVLQQLRATHETLPSHLRAVLNVYPLKSLTSVNVLPSKAAAAVSDVQPKETKVVPETAEDIQLREYKEAKQRVAVLAERFALLDANHHAANHFLALEAWRGQDFTAAINLWLPNVHKFATASSANMLGNCFEQGKGVKQDFLKAAKYYKLAIHHGCPTAMYNLAALQLRGHVSLSCDPMALLEQAAEKGVSKAQTMLGSIHFHKDEKGLAVKYYSQAAANGDADACYYLGICCETGVGGLGQSDTQAAELYARAAKAGHPEAQYNLGVFYEEGLGGVEPDQQVAAQWYQKAAEGGVTEALQRLNDIGGSRIKASSSLPTLQLNLAALLLDQDMFRSFSETQLTQKAARKTIDSGIAVSSASSSGSSLAEGTPRFFVPKDDHDSESFGAWSDEDSGDCDSQQLSCQMLAYDSSDGAHPWRTWSRDSLHRPDVEGPAVVFA